MATTYPLPSLAFAVDAVGISAPQYDDILASLKASFRLIYGDDAYLEADSKDGQLLGVFAKAIHDVNQQAIATYASFSPQTAVGVGLSNVIKINHMLRNLPSKSTVPVTLTGVAGTTIVDGVVGDDDGNRWVLPTPTTIPVGGTETVTATAEAAGNVGAPAFAIRKILVPTAGWQGVFNASAAVPGLPVESDATLRIRQEAAPSLNSKTTLAGLVAAVQAITGVSYGTAYENPTSGTDANGMPPHSIGIVVKGGDVTAIATAIYQHKGQGVDTAGTTTVAVPDVTGTPQNIKFFIPTEKPIKVEVSLVAGIGYNSAIGDEIKAAIVASINALPIFRDVVITRLYVPALLDGSAESATYRLTNVKAALVTAGSVGTSDIVMQFAEKATCALADVTLVVV